MEVKLPRQLQESNPNLANFVHTSYVRTPACWYCRCDVQARVLLCPWQTATCALFKLQNLFRTQKGSMKSWINADIRIACFTYWQVKEKFLCAPASVQNWQPKFLSTVMKRPDSWLCSLAFRKIKDRGSAITSSMEKAKWGREVQRQCPGGRSVSPSWYRAPPEGHDHVFNTAVIRLDPSLTIVDLSFVSNHTNLYRITKNLRSAFLHVFPNWKCGRVLNSMCYFTLRKSREYHFPQTCGFTRRAVNFANNEIYSSAKTFPLPIPFGKSGSS